MSLYSTFKTNQKAEREGRWFDIDYVANTDGTHPGFLMARMSATNPEYQAEMEKQSKELRNAIELDILTEEVAGPVFRAVFVNTILLDWRNVFDDNGVAIKYTKENALKLMTELPDLYQLLIAEAKKLANFREREVKDITGKSLPPSNQHSAEIDT